MGLRASIDETRCVGMGECVVLAPDLFDQRDHDGVSIVIAEPVTDDQVKRLLEAVKACPSGAISVR